MPTPTPTVEKPVDVELMCTAIRNCEEITGILFTGNIENEGDTRTYFLSLDERSRNKFKLKRQLYHAYLTKFSERVSMTIQITRPTEQENDQSESQFKGLSKREKRDLRKAARKSV